MSDRPPGPGGAKYPLMSITKSESLEAKAEIAPFVPAATMAAFAVITPVGAFSGSMGNGEAVMRDAKRGVNFAGSDPRTDGAAIPEQPAVPPLPSAVR